MTDLNVQTAAPVAATTQPAVAAADSKNIIIDKTGGMTEEQLKAAGLEVFAIKVTDKDTKISTTTNSAVHFPTKAEMLAILGGDDATKSDKYELAMVNGLRQIIRNQIIGGYDAPQTIEAFFTNEAERAEASGKGGEHLVINKEAIDSFIAFVTAAGVKAAAVVNLAKWLRSRGMEGLEAQPEATRNGVKKLAMAWIETGLTDAQVERFNKVLTKLDTALEGAPALDEDAFDI